MSTKTTRQAQKSGEKKHQKKETLNHPVRSAVYAPLTKHKKGGELSLKK